MNVVIIASYLLMPRLTFILTLLISRTDTRYTMSNNILLFSNSNSVLSRKYGNCFESNRPFKCNQQYKKESRED